MNTIQTNYQALVTEENEAPHESVIFQAASEGGKPNWNHIVDLDSFFKNIYEYHQKSGFVCIVVEETIKALVPLIVIFGFLYLINGVNFIFDVPPSPLHNKTVVLLSDLFLTPSEALQYFGLFSWSVAILGIFTAIWKCYKMYHNCCTFYEIKKFYKSAMKIDEESLSHLTWYEVQCRLREVQHEQQMCVQKSDLTELDISHRILRHTNYLVAMINKKVLPFKLKAPIIGEWIFLSSAYLFVMDLVLFSRFSPVFKETGKLSDEYKRYAKRKEAADRLQRILKYVSLISLVLFPYTASYTLASVFLKYAADVRFNPYRLFIRQWSIYSKYYLRHFNELDHELEGRLARAYKPAHKYMLSMPSALSTIIFKFLSRKVGAIAVLFLLWGIRVEKFFSVPHVLIIITVMCLLHQVFFGLIPEKKIYHPGRLMNKITAETHYIPDHFKGNAHLPAVRYEFSQLFQFKFVPIATDVVTVLILPYILYWKVYPRALDIVDFFRNFTIEVSGVGDVCSFALMDVSKHGNNQWQSGNMYTRADQREQAEGGKTELSLIHFTLMNPNWKPPPSSDLFIRDFRERVNTARDEQNAQNPYYASLNSLSNMGSKYSSLVNSLHVSQFGDRPEQHHFVNSDVEKVEPMSGGLSLVEGPPYLAQGGFLTSRQGDLAESLHLEASGLNPLEMRAADMSFGALYLHEVHKRNMESSSSTHPIPHQESEANDNEESPLLEVIPANYVQ